MVKPLDLRKTSTQEMADYIENDMNVLHLATIVANHDYLNKYFRIQTLQNTLKKPFFVKRKKNRQFC